MRFKKVMTWDPQESKLRLFRLMWERGVMGSGGYSSCLSLALMPKLFSFARIAGYRCRLVVFGLSMHYRRSYGGRFV